MTRRVFLQLASTALISTGAVARGLARSGQGLDRFTVPNSACKDDKPTPAVPDDKTFRAGAPKRSALADATTPGQKLVISGSVKGLICGAIAGARVDFWQADTRGALDAAGFKLRGYQLTDADGRYRLETIVPGPVAGHARRINAKIDAAGKPSLVTALFFADDPSNPREAGFRPELVLKTTPEAGGLLATFDFVLDA